MKRSYDSYDIKFTAFMKATKKQDIFAHDNKKLQYLFEFRFAGVFLVFFFFSFHKITKTKTLNNKNFVRF